MNRELAEIILLDGQPERAIHNYLIDTFELIDGARCIDKLEFDDKLFNKNDFNSFASSSLNNEQPLTKDAFIDALENVVHIMKNSLFTEDESN
tara:strand:+ start:1651 stop:1929 length:279 start_codon:yes stop_codon:yes gene_type:complete